MLNLLRKITFLYFITFLCASFVSYGQDIAEELATPVSSGDGNSEQFTEYIKIIGNSKKIFVMTNNNASLNAGDFITFIYDKKCTARALVAKNHKELIGVKIMKIYSLMQWARLKKGLGLQILKGDDNYYCGKKKKIVKNENDVKTGDEIFKESSVYKEPGGPDLTDYAARNLKTDHLFGGSLGMINSLDASGAETKYFNWNANYAYQFMDNLYLEGLLGQTSISQFPSTSKTTSIFNVEARLKYNFKTPYYTFIMPYMGFLYKMVNSPTAGQSSGSGQSASDLNAELTLISSMQGYNFVFGVTILRRLVPGWFIKADLSLDLMSAGFAIEF
jgi:hypothetical protein